MRQYKLSGLTPRPDGHGGSFMAMGILQANNALWTAATLSWFSFRDSQGNRGPFTFEEVCAGMLPKGESPDNYYTCERVQLDLDRLVELQLLEVAYLN